jgi:hypothetical protein
MAFNPAYRLTPRMLRQFKAIEQTTVSFLTTLIPLRPWFSHEHDPTWVVVFSRPFSRP